MGLSDEERRAGIYNTVNHIVKLKEEWESDKRIESFDLKISEKFWTLIDQMWSCIFNNMNNPMHWIIGSSTSNTIRTTDPTSAWDMGITQSLAEVVKRLDSTQRYQDNHPFEPIEYLSIANLLRANGNSWDQLNNYIFRLYQSLESLIYYLRRYPSDTFATSYDNLSNIVSSLCGQCYSMFATDEMFAKAYVAHQIIILIYGGKATGFIPADKQDVVQRIANKCYLHHDLPKLMKKSIDELVKLHVKFVKSDNQNRLQANLDHLALRLEVLLSISKKACNYKHVRDDILAYIKESPLDNEMQKWENLTTSDETENDNKIKYTEEHIENSLNAYSWHGYSLLHDDFSLEEGAEVDEQE